jgi:hypothetical protein
MVFMIELLLTIAIYFDIKHRQRAHRDCLMAVHALEAAPVLASRQCQSPLKANGERS